MTIVADKNFHKNLNAPRHEKRQAIFEASKLRQFLRQKAVREISKVCLLFPENSVLTSYFEKLSHLKH